MFTKEPAMNAVQTPVVTVVDGNATTLSTDVADFFEKRHDDVIKAIRKIVSSLSADRLGNFAETVVTRANPSGGAPIKSKAYRLTRDGFTFLAMGFTGARAQEFKWAYIDAFNKMEAALRQCPAQAQLPAPTLTEQQSFQILSEVAKRCKRNGVHYQTVYRALKARYQVTKYTHILQRDFDDAIEFIRTVDLRTPVVPEKTPEKQPQIVMTPEFCEHLRTLIYYWRYLLREEIDLVYQTMRAMESPHAGMLWEAIHDLNLVFLEEDLEKVGFPVKEMKSYQHWALRNNPN